MATALLTATADGTFDAGFRVYTALNPDVVADFYWSAWNSGFRAGNLRATGTDVAGSFVMAALPSDLSVVTSIALQLNPFYAGSGSADDVSQWYGQLWNADESAPLSDEILWSTMTGTSNTFLLGTGFFTGLGTMVANQVIRLRVRLDYTRNMGQDDYTAVTGWTSAAGAPSAGLWVTYTPTAPASYLPPRRRIQRAPLVMR